MIDLPPVVRALDEPYVSRRLSVYAEPVRSVEQAACEAVSNEL
jgi:hypothetical protein